MNTIRFQFLLNLFIKETNLLHGTQVGQVSRNGKGYLINEFEITIKHPPVLSFSPMNPSSPIIN